METDCGGWTVRQYRTAARKCHGKKNFIYRPDYIVIGLDDIVFRLDELVYRPDELLYPPDDIKIFFTRHLRARSSIGCQSSLINYFEAQRMRMFVNR